MKDIITTIVGNATADPVDRTQADGGPSASVRVAVTSRYFSPDKGEYVDRKTEFITVYARRHLARNLLASVRKGQPVIARGRLGSNEWEGENGPRFSLSLQAESLGHDLTFGTTVYVKNERLGETPNTNYLTGEIEPDPEADAGYSLGVSTGAEDGDLVSA